MYLANRQLHAFINSHLVMLCALGGHGLGRIAAAMLGAEGRGSNPSTGDRSDPRAQNPVELSFRFSNIQRS